MSLYEVLKASKTNRFPDYWTLLWGRKLSASMIKTITGVLPLTFTAKGGTAADWVIEGNAQGVGERTVNLFDKNASALVQIDTQGTMRFGVFVGALKTGTYTLSFDKDSSNTYSMWIVERRGTTYTQSASISASPYTFTLSSDADEVIVRTSYQTVTTWEALGFTNIMLVEGNTAPQTYIPYGYEIPISVQGKNLFDETNIQQGTIHEGSSIGTLYADVISPPYPSNRIVTSQAVKAYGMTVDCDFTKYQLFLAFFDDDIKYTANYLGWLTAKTVVTDANYKYMAIAIRKIDNSDILPSEISDVRLEIYKHINDYTFYIGSTPLTAGQSISKQSTGVDIELFEGENVLDTTLYNKPEMEIKYK